MTISEIHTSDLTKPCLRAVKLTREGKSYGETTGALFDGLLFHEFAAGYHNNYLETFAMQQHVVDSCLAENRPLSKAVVASLNEHASTVNNWLNLYAKRFKNEPVDVIGTELPIRMTLDIDGQSQEFASHLDLLLRHRQTGRLIVRDYKTGEDDPTAAYLARNLQLALYFLMVKEGTICLDPDLDHWVNFDEWPIIQWCHVRGLEPYKKAGVHKDTGEVYKKGDLRPMNKVIYEAPFNPAGRDEIVADLTERVRMMRANLYPKNPDPLGCFLCECRGACDNYLGGQHDE